MTKIHKYILSVSQLDRAAIALILVLGLLIGITIFKGDGVKPNVRSFSWQDRQIGAEDRAFSLVFSRPMDAKSVEDNLQINPPLAGKISWAGRRMVYTLLTPAPYGTNYQVSLTKAKDKFSRSKDNNRLVKAFTGKFSTRNRALVYIGVSPQEYGRLVLYNLTKEEKTILTPRDLIVMDFEPFPLGDKILFSARASNNPDLLSAQIYTVTTGVGNGQEEKSVGKLGLMLDNQEFQNLKFDLSPDGETLVVQRGKKDNPGDFGLWYSSLDDLGSNGQLILKRLEGQPAGDFIITPDSKAVAVAQGQGTAILSLAGDTSKPLDFLPQFGLVQAFSKDGSQAAMVKFNSDYTRDLFLVTNQGVQKPLLKTSGSILYCSFDPSSPTLYCLLTSLVSQDKYVEQPYLVAINLDTKKYKPILMLPVGQRNVQMSLAPDGLAVLFDQIVPVGNNSLSLPPSILKTDDGEAIAKSSLWFMPLLPIAEDQAKSMIKPEALPIDGFNPVWLP
jgi:Tol biopolymer transport system component